MVAPRVAPPSEMSRRLTFLFAFAAGVATGNLYWAQPLLGSIAGDLRAATATAGWLVTATQVGPSRPPSAGSPCSAPDT